MTRPGDTSFNPAWTAAVDLARHVHHGHGLPARPSTVLLDPGEVLHADLWADGWRFLAMDVFYDEPRVVAFGGPLLFATTALAAGSARRRARAEAERLAAPQWRSLGGLRILATERRLLVWFEGAWASVWYAGIREMHPDLSARRVTMTFDDDPPYALAGPWVPYLVVVMTTCMVGRLGVDVMEAALLPQ